MFVMNDDLSIYANRGDIVFFSVTADDNGILYKFQPGDIVRMAIYGKKEAENCVMQKDFPITEVTEKVFIFLDEQDTKIGDIISKHKDYWYEIVLNPDTMPQTIIGYDEDGAKVFRLFPESHEIDDNYDPKPEDFPVVDEKLDMTSPRPVSNRAVASAVATILDTCNRTNAAVTKIHVTPQMFGAIGDGKADDTEALQAAIDSGLRVYVPNGTYCHRGLTVRRACEIVGESVYWTILKNVGDGDSFTFLENVERGKISNIGIFGNGSHNLGATGATAKKGFVFANHVVHWTFENVWMRGHGEEYFYACGNGHVNNINIIDCKLEFGGKDCICFLETDYGNQINIINIQDCNISTFNGTGVKVWGKAINIQNNSIQLCMKYGIDVSIEEDVKTATSHAHGVNITGNYFEQCYYNFIYARAWFASGKVAYINGLRIEGNFGEYGPTNKQAIPSGCGCVKLQSMEYDGHLDNISGLLYAANGFVAPSGSYILDAGGKLNQRNFILLSRVSGMPSKRLQYQNLGKATVAGDIFEKVLYGKLHCISHNFSMNRMNDIVCNAVGEVSEIYFALPVNMTQLIDMEIETVTDSNNYALAFFACNSDFSEIAQVFFAGVKTGGTKLTLNASTANSLSQHDSFLMKIKLTNYVSGSKFSMKNIKYKHR